MSTCFHHKCVVAGIIFLVDLNDCLASTQVLWEVSPVCETAVFEQCNVPSEWSTARVGHSDTIWVCCCLSLYEWCYLVNGRWFYETKENKAALEHVLFVNHCLLHSKLTNDKNVNRPVLWCAHDCHCAVVSAFAFYRHTFNGSIVHLGVWPHPRYTLYIVFTGILQWCRCIDVSILGGWNGNPVGVCVYRETSCLQLVCLWLNFHSSFKTISILQLSNATLYRVHCSLS